MLAAMGIAAFLCIFLGSVPSFLYSLLPFEVDYHPYTYDHVIGQLQLLFFSAMAFTLLLLSGIYPAEMRSLNVDADYVYRKGGKLAYFLLDNSLNSINTFVNKTVAMGWTSKLAKYYSLGPARLSLAIVKPIWQLSGSGSDEIAKSEERLLKKFQFANFSIGSTAIFALGFLLLFLLF